MSSSWILILSASLKARGDQFLANESFFFFFGGKNLYIYIIFCDSLVEYNTQRSSYHVPSWPMSLKIFISWYWWLLGNVFTFWQKVKEAERKNLAALASSCGHDAWSGDSHFGAMRQWKGGWQNCTWRVGKRWTSLCSWANTSSCSCPDVLLHEPIPSYF